MFKDGECYEKNLAASVDADVYFYCYRIGGDEFGLFAYNTDDEKLVRRICTEILCRTNELSEDCIPVSVSIGVAVNKEYAPSYFDYYRAADKAMYLAKENGKGNYRADYF